MWQYDKKLQYPVKIKNPNPKLAQIIITQYGGPDGELGASMRYLSQRYSMPYDDVKGCLTDIGTEELAHLEMICAMVHQLTRNLTKEQIMQSGFDKYFVDHTAGVYPIAASSVPWDLLRLIDDPDILDPLKFLREREIVHYQRFGELLRRTTDRLDCRNFYACNPSFDKNCGKKN